MKAADWHAPGAKLNSVLQTDFARRFATPILGRIFVGAAVLLTLSIFSALFGVLQFGSIRSAAAYLDGYAVMPENAVLELGDVYVNQSVKGSFLLRNLTNSPLTLLGATPDCSCVRVSGVPAQMEPRGFCTLPVEIRWDRRSANTRISVGIHLHMSADSRPVVLSVKAMVCRKGEDDT